LEGEVGVRAPPEEVLTVPIYEFYCSECHAVFNFRAKTPNTRKRPACPRCGRPKLDRKISRFAISKGRSEPSQDDGLPADLDETKMERLLAEMAQQAEGADDEDPRQAARLLRGLHEGAGMPLGPGMEEAIRRMEAGEDPEKIEEEMGDLLDLEEPLSGPIARPLTRMARRLRPPEVDETLYDL
jgi:putative FmdB family regulatory protein